MKHKLELNEDDVRSLVAEHYALLASAVDINYQPAENDGPHHTPARLTFTITHPYPITPRTTPGDGQ